MIAADASFHGDDPRYLDRELSQLEFNLRVLELARDEHRPLLERIKFLAISASNTDEFFQKRMGSLRSKHNEGVVHAGGLSASEQLTRLRTLASRMTGVQNCLLEQTLFPALRDAGYAARRFEDLTAPARRQLTQHFEAHVSPILTPLAIDSGRPFPFVSSLALNMMIVVTAPRETLRRFARLKLPDRLARYIFVDGAIVSLEDLVAAHLDALFPGMTILEHHQFRVTRNADIGLEAGEVDDLLETVEERILRRRFGDAVRLETRPDMAPDVRQLLLRELDLTDDEVYETTGPLAPAALMSLVDQGPSVLKAPPWTPRTPPSLAGASGDDDIFDRIRDRDILVHHPYESFDASVGALIEAAASDPKVVGIKMTIYRTSESEDSIVSALTRAAQAGKHAVALVELKARFDEESNIARARRLEEAGVHVLYGFVGLKTHTKTLLLLREERDGIRGYAHVGTGNYNPKTARLYEDLGLLTADEDVADDLGQLFNTLTGFSRYDDYRRLIVAPHSMRDRLLDEIQRETRRDGGRLTVKVNNLVDREIIDALYEASEAGVEIDLVVRSLCALRPGVSGLSSRIRVRSIVGEFLEHSRIYRFGAGAEAKYFIGSADLMGRNLDRRFEALVAIEDAGIRRRLDHILETYLADAELAWKLESDGSWVKPPKRAGSSAHEAFKAAVRGARPQGAASANPTRRLKEEPS